MFSQKIRFVLNILGKLIHLIKQLSLVFWTPATQQIYEKTAYLSVEISSIILQLTQPCGIMFRQFLRM